MGKPYAAEMTQLHDTYQQALHQEIGPESRRAITALCKGPLLAVGSGGSLTAAHFASALHEASSGQPARATTPLGLLMNPCVPRHGVLIFSARGRNPDVLAAFEDAAAREAPTIVVLTRDADSPLAQRVRENGMGQVVIVDAGPAKDGFLATNTLLASLLVTYRLYQAEPLPPSLDAFAPEAEFSDSPIKTNVIALHGADGSSAAVDFESRCSEAGLAAVQVTDYRNFAHGRHHWLERHQADTSIVSFESRRDRALASQTLDALPAKIPRMRISALQDRATGSLELVVRSMRLVGHLGLGQDLDPGRPHVPQWGRDLYHLRPNFPRTSVPVSRKAHAVQQPTLGAFRTTAVQRVKSARIQALVLDYDGTIVDTHARFEEIPKPVATQLERLCREELPIGIATGRGNSAIEKLRSALREDRWPHVWLGLYGGAVLQTLDDPPPKPGPPRNGLKQVQAILTGDIGKSWGVFNIRANEHRLSVTPEGTQPLRECWQQLHELVLDEWPELQVRISSHSVDVMPSSTHKTTLVNRLCEEEATESDNVLRIGDQGAWPGNDFELLNHPLGLTVAEPSTSLTNCWDLAPMGLRGPGALDYYLARLQPKNKAWTLRLDDTALASARSKTGRRRHS